MWRDHDRTNALSVHSAAHYLQCSPAFVQTLIAKGELKTTGAARCESEVGIESYRSAKVLDIKPRKHGKD